MWWGLMFVTTLPEDPYSLERAPIGFKRSNVFRKNDDDVFAVLENKCTNNA